MQILVRDLLSLYNACRSGAPNPLEPLRIQYKDYAHWQQAQLTGRRLEAHRSYWLQQLGGELPVLDLSTDRPRPAVQTYRGDSYGFSWPLSLRDQLRELSQQQETTLFMLLLAGLNTLLYLYTGQEDLVIGSPVAGRDHADLEDQIGYYLNTLALRSRLSAEQSFTDLLQQVKATALQAYAHQAYPFDRLVEDLNLTRDLSRSPLFDVVLILQNIQVSQQSQVRMTDIEGEPVSAVLNTSKSDLRFQFTEQDGRLEGSIEYNTDLFEYSRIERMSRHLEQLFTAVAAQPGLPLRDIPYLLPSELQQGEIDMLTFNVELDSNY
jgi:non-ribosomal peptide synthetase component F